MFLFLLKFLHILFHFNWNRLHFSVLFQVDISIWFGIISGCHVFSNNNCHCLIHIKFFVEILVMIGMCMFIKFRVCNFLVPCINFGNKSKCKNYKEYNIYHIFTFLSYTSFEIVIIFQQSSQPKPLLFLSLVIIPHSFFTILRWLSICLGSHYTLNFWLIFVATLTKDSALKVEEGLFPLSASSTNISSSMWDISLDHVKCLPLHFSFCVILISTKKKL